MTFTLDTHHIESHLKELASRDPHVANAIKLVGMPAQRQRPQGFKTLLHIIVGQQLSVKAAASIWNRVETLAGEGATLQDYDTLDDESLRTAGLSRQKIAYFRSLCEKLLDGSLKITDFPALPDADVIQQITSVKGLGVWSAHMYLMFSLGRPNIWPVGDLAVRVGIARIIGEEDRPSEKKVEQFGERWHPYRSSMALLAWHYYSNAPF